MIFRYNLKNILPGEWIFVLVVSVLVVLATTIPYIYGWLSSSDVFLWSNYSSLGDTTVYLSLMKQASQGNFFLANLYTSEFSYSLMIRPFWLSLGFLAGLTGLPEIFIYQLGRIFFGFLLLFFLYLFLSYFLQDKRQRKICFLLLAFGSGVGAFFHPLYYYFSANHTIAESINILSSDLIFTEANIFLMIFHSPLYSAALLVQLLIIYLFFKSDLKAGYWLYFVLFILVVFLGVFHPYDLLMVASIPGFFIFIIYLLNFLGFELGIELKLFLKKLGIICFALVIIFCYYLFLFYFDPFFPHWAQTNFTESSPIINLLTGYGFILIFALAGIYLWPNKKSRYFIFLSGWLIINLFFAYIPFSQARRVLPTIFIPLAIFAAFGLSKFFVVIFKSVKYKHFKYLALVLIFLVFSISNISVIMSNILFYKENNQAFYFSQDNYQAALWFEAKKDKVILALPLTSNPIPAITANKVYVGHLHQTIDYYEKFEVVKWFFATDNQDSEKKQWLKKEMIDYIFYSKLEKSLGQFRPDQKDYLQEVYSNNEVKIYQVLLR